MFEMLRYDFMIKALVLGICLALATAAVGQHLVLRRMSQMGDALSHSSLAGVALGLILGLNPVAGALLAAVAAAFCIELLKKFFPRYAEIAISLVFSTGIGLAAVLSGFTKTGNFNSFLFGSIVAISHAEMYLVSTLALLVFGLSRIFSRKLCFITFDQEAALLSGVKVHSLNTLFTLMTALTIALASRTIGALVVSSMLVIPYASAMQVGKSYRQTQQLSVILSVLFTILGLWLSFQYNLKPGGTIVLLSVFGLILSYFAKEIFRRKAKYDSQKREQ